MGKGTLGTWRFHRAARLSDTELARLWKKGQGFKPDPGNLAVRHYRGASGNVVTVEL